MKMRITVLALASVLMIASQLTPTVVVGKIEGVYSSEIRVRAGTELVTFQIDSEAKNDFTDLRGGSEISIHGVKDASGKLIARSISAKITTFRGIVKNLDRSASTIVVAPMSSSKRTKESSSTTIHFFPNTVFSIDRTGLAVGQEVLVVGLALRGGFIDATRITIYNTDFRLN